MAVEEKTAWKEKLIEFIFELTDAECEYIISALNSEPMQKEQS